MRIAALFLISMTLVACDESASDPGQTPIVSDFALTPTAVTVGESSTLTGTVQIDDEDGDVEALLATIEGPGGVTELPETPVAGASGKTRVSARLQILLMVPTAGSYTIRVRAMDAESNVSESVSTTVEASE